jgi:transforming growth factor-beta-induced protein
MRKSLVALAAGAAALGMIAAPAAAQTEPSIAEIAVGDDDFATLVAAASAAGLVPTLSDCSTGPLTVFAPTNAAFAAALAALGIEAADLLADIDTLTSILTYHVVAGKVMAADVVTLESATTLNGADISIAVVDGSVKLNGTTTVVATDIEACNGVIHVIDSVLLPPAATAEPVTTTADGGLPETGTSNAALTLLAVVAMAGGALMLVVRRRVTA